MNMEKMEETGPTAGEETNHQPSDGGETQTTLDETESTEVPAKTPRRRKRASWIWWTLLALSILIAVVAISGLLGYWNGIRIRQAFEATQVASTVDEYFNLGIQNMEAGRYFIAQQQFQYVIQLDPSYPGVTDKLAEVMLILNATSTPTPAPTATPTPIPFTPTPDTRGEAEIFAQAEDYIKNEDWSAAIATLETLRKIDPEYRAIEVDGKLYLCLRQRGVQKISEGNLEGGIYDLSLAERFGILDTEADSWRTWAQYYIRGASFWGVDWSQAVYYFEQVAPMFPNMHDGTFWTASQRYKEALTQYAQQLETGEYWCEAEEQYIKLRDLTGDPSLDETIAIIADKCR
jgi:tetratricopeptide (TPR) repeat protein